MSDKSHFRSQHHTGRLIQDVFRQHVGFSEILRTRCRLPVILHTRCCLFGNSTHAVLTSRKIHARDVDYSTHATSPFWTLKPQHSTLNSQASALKPHSSTLNPASYIWHLSFVWNVFQFKIFWWLSLLHSMIFASNSRKNRVVNIIAREFEIETHFISDSNRRWSRRWPSFQRRTRRNFLRSDPPPSIPNPEP